MVPPSPLAREKGWSQWGQDSSGGKKGKGKAKGKSSDGSAQFGSDLAQGGKNKGKGKKGQQWNRSSSGSWDWPDAQPTEQDWTNQQAGWNAGAWQMNPWAYSPAMYMQQKGGWGKGWNAPAAYPQWC